MQPKELLKAIRSVIDKKPNEFEAYQDYFDTLRLLGKEDKAKSFEHNLWLRQETAKKVMGSTDPALIAKFYELSKKTYLYPAQDDFDSYCLYLEWNREPQKRFYQPRRKVLWPLVKDLQDLAGGKLDFLGVSLPPRVGKALAFETPVMTRNGWKQHGDLTIRDEVLAPNGQFVKVLAIHPVCGMEYEVSFSNGEKIICHGNHEWTVFNRHRQKQEVLETRAMIAGGIESGGTGRGHRYHYMLPNRTPIHGTEKALPVDPYTLGVWLGDGANRNPTICNAKTDKIIIDTILKNGYTMAWDTVHKDTGVHYYGFSELRQQLQSVGMCHSRRKVPKHIPSDYLTASIEQRLELLAGLLDTDGTLVSNERRYQFVTAEETLRDDFVSLISSFGWRCGVSQYQPAVSSSGIGGKRPYWSVGFNPNIHIPCRVERKRLFEFSEQRRIAITDIKPHTGAYGNCISVEGGEYLVGKTMLPTHNSTLCIFFMTWLMGKKPDVANVMSGHSDKLTDGFYREVLSILTDKENYLWGDVFPAVRVVDNSAKNETIDLNRKKRFPTFTARSVGGTLTGAVEIGEGGCLYVDDLIEDLEESLNPDRLQAKYDAYLNQLKDRKKEGAIELMVGTRWNVLDPLGRIHEQYADNPRYRFRVIPALNEQGKSNFEYQHGLGFSTAYYEDMKASIDDATWCAKYMGKPYVREGLLFPSDELRYYNGVLPDGEAYKVAVCDVAWGGGDSTAMPFAYVYGDAVYIHDVVFNRGDKTVTQPVIVGRTKQHMPHKQRYEANNGGSEFCDAVDQMLRKDGVHVNLTARRAPNNQSKMGRIIQFSPDIKKFYFIDEKNRSKEYQAFMEELCTFSQTGKNPHDDAPDSLAMLADELYHGSARVEVCKRIW
jgi:predicted phage terminase large subunit-like protein